MADEVPTKAVALRMRLGFDTVEDFEQGYRRFVTAQGIFLASRTPRDTGTSLRFELQTRDGGARLLVAEGRVVGVRPADPDHPKRVPGMHVRFTRLTEESRLRIHRMARPANHAPAASAATDAGDGPSPAEAADALRAPTPAPVPSGDPSGPSSDAGPAQPDALAPATDWVASNLPNPDASPFRDVFDKLFGMGEGAPPSDDPFDMFLQADLPTADGEPLEEVPELSPDSILP